MPCENSARRRSKTLAFRCTPEEYKLICDMAAWSGMGRQDYIIAKLADTQITVKPSVSVQKALRDSMAELAKEVRLAASYGELSESLKRRIELVMRFFLALGEDRVPIVGVTGRFEKRRPLPRIELYEGNRFKRRATATDGHSTGKGSSARPADPRGRNDRHQRDDEAPARGDGRPGHGLAGRRAVRGGQPAQRLPGAQAGRHGRRDHAAHTQAARGARTSRTGPSGPTRGSTAPWSASSGRPAYADSRPGGQGRPPTRSGSRRRSPRASRA